MGKKSRRTKQKAPARQQNEQQVGRSPASQAQEYRVPRVEPVLLPFVTDSLVGTVLERGGVPENLNSFEALQGYLKQIFTAPVDLLPFLQALAEGLEKGPPLINRSTQLSLAIGNIMPLLHWVCQFEFLNAQYGCYFSDGMVELVLNAGGSFQSDKCTLFCCQVYLPEVCEFVAPSWCKHQPTRSFWSDLSLQCHGASETPGDLPISWVGLGPPTIDDVRETFMLLRQKGVRLAGSFSTTTLSVSIGNPTHPDIRDPIMLQKLAEDLVGLHVPKGYKFKQEDANLIEILSLEAESENDTCPICLKGVKRGVTLYCDHRFCKECILEYGKVNIACPLCQAQLCTEVSPNSRRGLYHNLLGIDEMASKRRGPRFFTNEQVIAEAKAQGIYNLSSSSESLREQLETWLSKGIQSSQQMVPLGFSAGEGPHGRLEGRGRIKLELASNTTMLTGSPPSALSMCPKFGMKNIEVSINDVPLVARISNQSLYTMFSRAIVDQLGLKRIHKLKSKKFVGFDTKKLKNKTFTCLEPVKICLQGIAVTLRNAIEVSPSPSDFMLTVQLGLDFLRSGLLSVVDVEGDMEVGDEEEGGNYFRVVGEDSWTILSQVSRESFRFYSHDGKMADLPLITFDPFMGTADRHIATISVKASTSFAQCNWCCRMFPEGMSECSNCSECFYCDERCQNAAWKIHKLNCGVSSNAETKT
ncbi:unnamed protein product [Cylindrotheca closterium]|uniref:RING-type domain-containing protein n=1 Tax=Cylindrotheca closterium TaxID=2856 RepID=A0AAD2FL79_9STRA|nr:unnamed protein product [Cylindrotheca closterium]